MILEEIPLLAGASDQTADIVLDDQPLTIRVLWNERFGYWSLSVLERDGSPLITNVKMVNNYPLTGRFHLLDLPGDLYFLHKAGKTYRPTFDDVGGEYGLFYFDAEVVDGLPVPLSPVS